MVRKTLTISPTSWHGKVYKYWRDRARYKAYSSYRENLCHYCRVIMFWAPLSWFVNASPYKKQTLPNVFVRPISIMASLAVICGAIVSFMLAPAGSLVGLAIIGGVLLAAVLAVVALVLIDDHNETWLDFWEHVGNGLYFVAKWLIGKPISRVYKLLFKWWLNPSWDHALEPSIDWLFSADNRWDASPLAIFFIFAFCCASVVGLLTAFIFHLGVALIVLAVVATIVLLVSAVYACRFVLRRIALWVARPTASFTQALAERAISKKHGICPFIEVPDGTEA